jgi:GntR family transcriptional regulator / MocR family aminotransferase
MSQSWANSGLDLHLDTWTRGRGSRVRASLEAGLRAAIQSGRLAPGTALPPSRALAYDLGVARNTVTEAYAQLIAEGWLIGRQGSATRVAQRPGEVGPDGAATFPQSAPPRYDLRAGFPDVSSFPRAEWSAAERAALTNAPSSALGYGSPSGAVELRAALAGYLARARAVRLRSDRLVVCGGFTSGLGLIADALRARGIERVAVERYGHAKHRAVLAAAGVRTFALPVDAGGAVPEGLDEVGAVLLTPAHQFPLGAALDAKRRSAFIAWAARTGGLIIEDDYDGEFRYDRRALGAMQALAPDHVVYGGTASKALAPGLRLGWLVVPPTLLNTIVERMDASHQQPGVLAQLTLATFIESGRYDRHVRRVRTAYRMRRDKLVDGLTRRAPALRTIGLNAGLHLTLELADSASETEVVERCAARDLAVDGLAGYHAGGAPDRSGLVIGYATPPPHAFSAALARLLTALD